MATYTARIPGGRIGSFLAGAAVASVIGGTAIAITSPDFTYSAAKHGYFTIDPMAMAPANNTSAQGYFILYASRLEGDGCYQTGVNLPQGATVLSVTTWYSSGASSNPTVHFFRQNLPNNLQNKLAGTVIFDNSATRKPITHTVPANLRTVNNLHFSYAYGICLGSGNVFYGARVNYLYRTAGD